MISINDSTIVAPKETVGAKCAPSKPVAVLKNADVVHLNHHLTQCEQNGCSILAHILRQKIKAARRPIGPVPEDVVAGGARVIFAVKTAPAEAGLLVHRARYGAKGGVIPIASLLGVTLIGMRVGQTAPMPGLDGTVAMVTALGVAQHS